MSPHLSPMLFLTEAFNKCHLASLYFGIHLKCFSDSYLQHYTIVLVPLSLTLALVTGFFPVLCLTYQRMADYFDLCICKMRSIISNLAELGLDNKR